MLAAVTFLEVDVVAPVEVDAVATVEVDAVTVVANAAVFERARGLTGYEPRHSARNFVAGLLRLVAAVTMLRC